MRIYPGTTVDYEFATLGGLGYTGTLNDRQFAALRAEGLTGSLPDMFGQFDGELGGEEEPPIDYDALMLALLSDDAHMVLDFSDLTRMWQESTKTTLVSADGQGIGAIDTKFGTAARTMQNANSTGRPLLASGGWALCDGTNDGLGANANVFSLGTSTNGLSATLQIFPTALPTTMGLVGLSTNTTTNPRFQFSINADGSILLSLRRLDTDGAYTITSAAGVIIANNYYTVSARVNYLTGACDIRVNGVQVISGTLPGVDGVNGTSATASARARVLINLSGSPGYFTGYCGAITVARKYLSDAEILIPEGWRTGLISDGGAFILGVGGRTWFNSPVVINDGGMTYVNAAQDDGKTSRVLAWNRDTGTARIAHKTSTTAGDDHDEGGLIKLADGTFLHISVGHNVGSVYAATGGSMFALSEAGISSDLNRADMTYSNLWQATGLSGSPIYQFGRGGGASVPRPQCFSVSTDGGASWTEYEEWVWDEANGLSPYCQYAANAAGTQFHIIGTTTHPDLFPTGPVKNKIWHGYFDGTNFRKTDGTIAGTIPILPGDFTTVHDGSATGDNNGGWVWDLKWIGSELVGVFASFPTTTEHRYHRCVLSGGVWSVETVVADAGTNLYGGEPYYSGGICCHPTNKDILYAAIEDGSGVYQINRMDRVSDGNWTATPLTTGSVRSFRPDAQGSVLTFVRGTYTSYTNFPDCKIMGILI